MPQTRRSIALALTLTLAATASAQPLNEDFESGTVGEMPGDPWQDVTTRIDNPTVPSPTGEIVQTTDHEGAPTQAFRINDAFGSSQGILAEIGPSATHQVSADVRIDQLAQIQGWPIAAGFLGSTPGATDFNQDVQAVIYANSDFTWHLFVKKGLSVGQDQIISGANWELGQWYNLDISFDVATGALDASITNAATGELEASRSRVVTTWKGNEQVFDAVAFYDGEYANSSTARGAVTLIDNVHYVPAPGSAVPLLGSLALVGRRRRR